MTRNFKHVCATEMEPTTLTDAHAFLGRILAAHRAFKTFRCRAKMRRHIVTDSKIESVFEMQLAFSRPRNMFLQWWLEGSHKNRVMLATDTLVIEHSFGDLEWQQEASIDDVLARHAGISSGLSLHVPSLLLGCEGYRLFEEIRDFGRVRDGTNRECWILVGLGSASITRSVWIRTSDLTILRMIDHFTIPNGSVECDSEYLDVEADADEAP
jgi:hypothetical protein